MLASASYPEAADPVRGCAVSVIAYDTLPSLVTAEQEVANKGDKWQQRAHQHPHNSNNSIAALLEGPQGCIFAAILLPRQRSNRLLTTQHSWAQDRRMPAEGCTFQGRRGCSNRAATWACKHCVWAETSTAASQGGHTADVIHECAACGCFTRPDSAHLPSSGIFHHSLCALHIHTLHNTANDAQ